MYHKYSLIRQRVNFFKMYNGYWREGIGATIDKFHILLTYQILLTTGKQEWK